jgi:hypothetical protein
MQQRFGLIIGGMARGYPPGPFGASKFRQPAIAYLAGSILQVISQRLGQFRYVHSLTAKCERMLRGQALNKLFIGIAVRAPELVIEVGDGDDANGACLRQLQQDAQESNAVRTTGYGDDSGFPVGASGSHEFGHPIKEKT